jgi:hypothetical protein
MSSTFVGPSYTPASSNNITRQRSRAAHVALTRVPVIMILWAVILCYCPVFLVQAMDCNRFQQSCLAEFGSYVMQNGNSAVPLQANGAFYFTFEVSICDGNMFVLLTRVAGTGNSRGHHDFKFCVVWRCRILRSDW